MAYIMFTNKPDSTYSFAWRRRRLSTDNLLGYASLTLFKTMAVEAEGDDVALFRHVIPDDFPLRGPFDTADDARCFAYMDSNLRDVVEQSIKFMAGWEFCLVELQSGIPQAYTVMFRGPDDE